MRPIDAEELIRSTINNPLHVPYITKTDVEATPTLEIEPQWTPCSERLPNHDECIKNNGLFNVSDGDRSYSEWYDNDKRRFGEPTMSGFRVDYAVIAWMPLPEPYLVKF
ncbi:MAG: hypothetical protein IKE02_03890 [Lachnospiraceae bacterium]|nr:hypothetical protein [Lachnospiraceae bacterium]